MSKVVTKKPLRLRIVSVREPGWIGLAGSCAAAANSVTLGTVSSFEFTEMFWLV